MYKEFKAKLIKKFKDCPNLSIGDSVEILHCIDLILNYGVITTGECDRYYFNYLNKKYCISPLEFREHFKEV